MSAGEEDVVVSLTLGMTTVSAAARSASPYDVRTVAPPNIRTSGFSEHSLTEYQGVGMPAENAADRSCIPKISAARPDSKPDIPS